MYTDGGNSINAEYNDLILRDLQTNFDSLYFVHLSLSLSPDRP